MAMTPEIPPVPRQASRSRSQHRYRMLLSACALAAGCAMLAAACGSTAAPGTSAPGSSAAAGSSAGTSAAASSGAGAPSAAKVSLDVTFTASPTTAARPYTLRCEPSGGTVPDAAAACAKLLKMTSLFAPRPTHVMCPMIMANAGRAIVTGTYYGKKVHETIVDGGCDLAKWASLHEVFN